MPLSPQSVVPQNNGQGQGPLGLGGALGVFGPRHPSLAPARQQAQRNPNPVAALNPNALQQPKADVAGVAMAAKQANSRFRARANPLEAAIARLKDRVKAASMVANGGPTRTANRSASSLHDGSSSSAAGSSMGAALGRTAGAASTVQQGQTAPLRQTVPGVGLPDQTAGTNAFTLTRAKPLYAPQTPNTPLSMAKAGVAAPAVQAPPPPPIPQPMPQPGQQPMQQPQPGQQPMQRTRPFWPCLFHLTGSV